MKAIRLRSYQIKAIDAIQEALGRKQKHIVVEIATGCGKEIVLAKTVEMLNKQKEGNVLVVTNRLAIKERVEYDLFKTYQDVVEVHKDNVTIETEQRILRHQKEIVDEYQFVIFYDTDVSVNIYNALFCEEKTVIIFSVSIPEKAQRLFAPNEVVFSYSYKDAVDDGYLTPAMDVRAFAPAVEAFCEQLLEQFGCNQIDSSFELQERGWDLIAQKAKQRVWVECKTYKSQVVSPTVASSLLKTVIMRKRQQAIPQEDIVLLVILSQIPSFQKKEIYER